MQRHFQSRLAGVLQKKHQARGLREFGGLTESARQFVIFALAAADQADVAIRSGGVPVGEEDPIKSALSPIVTLELWRECRDIVIENRGRTPVARTVVFDGMGYRPSLTLPRCSYSFCASASGVPKASARGMKREAGAFPMSLRCRGTIPALPPQR
jgi:hypothetical protein